MTLTSTPALALQPLTFIQNSGACSSQHLLTHAPLVCFASPVWACVLQNAISHAVIEVTAGRLTWEFDAESVRETIHRTHPMAAAQMKLDQLRDANAVRDGATVNELQMVRQVMGEICLTLQTIRNDLRPERQARRRKMLRAYRHVLDDNDELRAPLPRAGGARVTKGKARARAKAKKQEAVSSSRGSTTPARTTREREPIVVKPRYRAGRKLTSDEEEYGPTREEEEAEAELWQEEEKEEHKSEAGVANSRPAVARGASRGGGSRVIERGRGGGGDHGDLYDDDDDDDEESDVDSDADTSEEEELLRELGLEVDGKYDSDSDVVEVDGGIGADGTSDRWKAFRDAERARAGTTGPSPLERQLMEITNSWGFRPSPSLSATPRATDRPSAAGDYTPVKKGIMGNQLPGISTPSSSTSSASSTPSTSSSSSAQRSPSSGASPASRQRLASDSFARPYERHGAPPLFLSPGERADLDADAAAFAQALKGGVTRAMSQPASAVTPVRQTGDERGSSDTAATASSSAGTASSSTATATSPTSSDGNTNGKQRGRPGRPAGSKDKMARKRMRGTKQAQLDKENIEMAAEAFERMEEKATARADSNSKTQAGDDECKNDGALAAAMQDDEEPTPKRATRSSVSYRTTLPTTSISAASADEARSTLRDELDERMRNPPPTSRAKRAASERGKYTSRG